MVRVFADRAVPLPPLERPRLLRDRLPVDGVALHKLVLQNMSVIPFDPILRDSYGNEFEEVRQEKFITHLLLLKRTWNSRP